MSTYVLVHGAWLTPRCWERFEESLTEQGHGVFAPAWPGHDRSVEDIRADPAPIAGVSLGEIVDHYADVVRGLPEPPIPVGHSFGGLVVQLLVDRGLGAAGVALDPAPPNGVRIARFSLRASWPVFSNPLNRNRAVALSFEQFRYAFVNTWPEADARAAYDRYAVPETGRIFFQAGSAGLNPRAATAVDFDEFAGRSHLLVVGDGWRESAKYVEEWAERTVTESAVRA